MKLKTKYLLFVGTVHLLMLALSFVVFERNRLLFLASEVMLFGALFSSYILLRVGAPEGTWPHHVLNVPIGTVNKVSVNAPVGIRKATRLETASGMRRSGIPTMAFEPS